MSDFFDELFRRIERRFREIEDELRREVERVAREALGSAPRPSRYSDVIEPLYTVRDLGDRLVVHVDLPHAAGDSVEVWFEGRTMNVRARLKAPIDVGRWSRGYRGVEVRGYRASISLPFEPRPERTRLRIRGDVLEVTIYK
ncbi:MAG: hypothetical protein ABWK00_03615 [Desulfurococcaceae archaeon]